MKLKSTSRIQFLFFAISITIYSCSLSVDPNHTTVVGWRNGPSITKANDRNLSLEQRQKYHRDAEILSIRYVNQKDSTQLEIPNPFIELLYNGLIHIANSDLAKTQEVTQRFNIHVAAPNPREIVIYIDTTETWLDNWRNGKTRTGNEKIDELINRFNFNLSDYNEMQSLPRAKATLHSDHAINVYAVGHLFERYNNIQSAVSGDTIGDGNNIHVLFFNDHLQYRFGYGYGDCLSGCIKRHIWKFNVYSDGTVAFVGEEGPLPKRIADIKTR